MRQPQQQGARLAPGRPLSPSRSERRRIEACRRARHRARLADANHEHRASPGGWAKVRVRPEIATGAPPTGKWAVSVRHRSSTIVFARCSGITIARARLSSWAPSPEQHEAGRQQGSTTMKTSEAIPARLAGWRAANRSQGSRRPARGRPAGPRRSRGLCENSISIAVSGARGHHFTVAERPVGAAAGARPGGAHVRAPEDGP